jgi:hypothetical protein
MRQANLEPPRFEDRRSSFWVTFRNHSLMSPDAIAWLNQLARLALNDRQRLALVYLRHNDRMANSDYQRLCRVDSTTAGRELRRILVVHAGPGSRTAGFVFDQLLHRHKPLFTLPSPENEHLIAKGAKPFHLEEIHHLKTMN